MKELSIEEKAKRYDEAIERAKEMIKDMTNIGGVAKVDDIQHIFPELKESEDERIRKEIRDFICWATDRGSITREQLEKSNSWLAWLEKQGEQKPAIKFKIGDIIKCGLSTLKVANINYNKNFYELKTKEGIIVTCISFAEQDKWELVEQKSADKVEPKFKVGDWVVQKGLGIYKIVEVCEFWYEVISYKDGIQYSIGFDKENDCHLWTIQDAKEGDVLATNSWLFMFKYTNNKALIQFHCKCPINGTPFIWCWLSDNSYLDIYIDANIHPATKEQRNLLFQKMKEAGYEWDAEKKELKKIEQKPDDVEPIVIRDFNSVFSREQVEETDKRIEKSQRLYNAKLRDAMQKAKDFPMTD